MSKKLLNINNWLILIFSPVSFFILLLAIILKPILTIRIGHVLTYRFGHSIKDIEMYLSEKRLNIEKNKKYLDLFFLSYNPANKYIQKTCRKYLKVLPTPILFSAFKTIEIISKKNNIFKKHYIEMRNYDYDLNNSFDKINCQLNFSQSEIEEAESQLKQIGINPSDNLVCLCVRDENYAIKHLNHPKKFDSKARSFMDIRNSEIEDYKLASTALAKLGYKVIRVGKDTGKKISFTDNKIIDYSKSEIRNDFLDVYLAYRCKFAFGDSAGWTQAPVVFRKHVAFANWAPYSVIDFVGKNFYIFKHYYDKNLKRNLTIKEIFERKLHKLFLFDLQKNGIVLKDNSPEELLELVLEVESKFRNKIENHENISNNAKFRDFLTKNKFFSREDNPDISPSLLVKKYKINSHVGEKYLKKYFI